MVPVQGEDGRAVRVGELLRPLADPSHDGIDGQLVDREALAGSR